MRDGNRADESCPVDPCVRGCAGHDSRPVNQRSFQSIRSFWCEPVMIRNGTGTVTLSSNSSRPFLLGPPRFVLMRPKTKLCLALRWHR